MRKNVILRAMMGRRVTITSAVLAVLISTSFAMSVHGQLNPLPYTVQGNVTILPLDCPTDFSLASPMPRISLQGKVVICNTSGYIVDTGNVFSAAGLPPSGPNGGMKALSDNRIVGYAQTPGGLTVPVRWSGYPFALPQSVSSLTLNAGQATATAADDSASAGNIAFEGGNHLFKFVAGVFTDLGAPGVPDGAPPIVLLTPTGITPGGELIVGYVDFQSGLRQAFKYSNGTAQFLDLTDGAIANDYRGVSQDGLIVGNWTFGTGGQFGFLINNGVTTTILPFAADVDSTVTAISADGTVLVGYSKNQNGTIRPFEYFGSTMVDLSALSPLLINAKPTGVALGGKAIVGTLANGDPFLLQ